MLLVLANGFFVATEFAFVSVRRTRIQQLAADGNSRAQHLLNELSQLDTYVAATQLGITIASLALGWIGESAVAAVMAPLIGSLQIIPEASRDAVTHTISFAIAFSLIATLRIVLGELAPKSIALQSSEQTALWAARPIHLIYLALRPAIIGDEILTPFGQVLRTEAVEGLRVARVRVLPANDAAATAEALTGSAA